MPSFLVKQAAGGEGWGVQMKGDSTFGQACIFEQMQSKWIYWYLENLIDESS
jgi:hypothetical protein